MGRRVIMSADVFGGSADQCYHGVVISKGKYRQGGKTHNGFKVRWHVGDSDYWYVYTHTMYTHTTHNLPVQHTHTSFNRSYKDLIGCVVEEDDTFVDADWILLRQVLCVV